MCNNPTQLAIKIAENSHQTRPAKMEQQLVQIYAQFTKKMDALIDLNYTIEEDEEMEDLSPDEVIEEEEAGWYIEDMNKHLIELHNLCKSIPDNQRLVRSGHVQDIITFVKNWELGKWEAEYAEYSKYSPIPLMSRP